MKRLLFVLLLAFGLRAVGQNTTISSSMTDSDGTIWAGAMWKIDFRPNPSTPNESSYRLLNGQPLVSTVTHQTGSLNGTGNFTIVIYDSTLITPSGSGWTLTLCSLSSAPCGQYQFTSAGTTMDISSRLTTSIPAPRFLPNAGAYGYADVEVQTSINQGAIYWNVISQTQRVWNGTTWVVGAGGPSLPPGMSSDNNNGLIVQGNISAGGSVTTSSLPGYRQNTVTARSRNRDEILQITITPQDMPGCAQAGQGLIDDAPCFNQAIQYMNSTDPNVQKRLLVPWTQYGYKFLNPYYYVPLPHDFGDYHGFAGFTAQVAVSLQITNGVITGCTATGGSGYVVSATLPVAIYDSSLKGSGGYVTVSTDATGTPISPCNVIKGGTNYSQSNIYAFAMPLGGDGAAGTAALSAAGTFTVGAITSTSGASGVLTNGGSGYGYYGTAGGYMPVSLQAMTVPASGSNPSLVCTTYPTFTSQTGTGAQGSAITQVNVTGAGSGCVWEGLASTAASVPLVFGASCGGLQCGLIAPEPVVFQPCAVALINNLTIEGVGGPTINGTWANGVPDVNSMIGFCDPTGVSSTNIIFKNISFQNMFIAAYFPLEVNHLVMDNVWFKNYVAHAVHVFSFAGTGAGTNLTTVGNSLNTAGVNPPFAASSFTNILDNGYSFLSCGGEWISRNPVPYGASGSGNSLSVIGVTPVAAGGSQNLLMFYYLNGQSGSNTTYSLGHFLGNDWAGGPCGNVSMENITFSPLATTNTAIAQAIDTWFEKNLWKTQNGPSNPITSSTFVGGPYLMNNGLYSSAGGGLGCKFTQTITTDRTTDYQFGYVNSSSLFNGTVVGGPGAYPYYQCFSPMTMSAVIFQPRYNYPLAYASAAVGIKNIFAKSVSNRPVITGRFDALRVERLQGHGYTNFQSTDPYFQTGMTISGISVAKSNTNITPTYSTYIEDVVSTATYPSGAAPFIRGLQTLFNGLPTDQFQYHRNVFGISDQYPIQGSIGSATPPTPSAGNPAPATLNLVDTWTGAGSGGNLLISGNNAPSAFFAVKGSYAGTASGANTFGDLVFYGRANNNPNPFTEYARLDYQGRWKTIMPDIASGSLPTISGCTIGSSVGAAAAGKFQFTGTTGTCTLTLSWIGRGYAPNYYYCTATNVTTPANVFSQNATITNGSCVLTGTLTTNDVILWRAIAF